MAVYTWGMTALVKSRDRSDKIIFHCYLKNNKFNFKKIKHTEKMWLLWPVFKILHPEREDWIITLDFWLRTKQGPAGAIGFWSGFRLVSMMHRLSAVVLVHTPCSENCCTYPYEPPSPLRMLQIFPKFGLILEWDKSWSDFLCLP